MIDPKLLQVDDCVVLESLRSASVVEPAFQHLSGRWDVWVRIDGGHLERVPVSKLVSVSREGRVIY